MAARDDFAPAWSPQPAVEAARNLPHFGIDFMKKRPVWECVCVILNCCFLTFFAFILGL